jgi:hypothetical protein
VLIRAPQPIGNTESPGVARRRVGLDLRGPELLLTEPDRHVPIEAVARRLMRTARNDEHSVSRIGPAEGGEEPLLGRVFAAPRGRPTSSATPWVRDARGRLSSYSEHSSKLRLQRFARIGERRDLGDARSESPSI